MADNLLGVNGRRLALIAVVVCAALLIGFIVSLLGISVGPIYIKDVILTTGLNADGSPVDDVTQFVPAQSRIYCVVKVEAPPGPMRWWAKGYYEDRLLRDAPLMFDKQGAWAIQVYPGQMFAEGQYRVEIYLDGSRKPAKVVYFTVKRRSG